MKKKDSPFSYESANDATGFLLWKAHNFWQREIKKNLKELDLTHTQFVILANTQWLVLQQDVVTQIEIAKHAQVDTMMTSNIIRTLIKKGLLDRVAHKTDTRAKVISLTSKGKKIVGQAILKVEQFDREFFSSLKNTSSFNKELIRLMS